MQSEPPATSTYDSPREFTQFQMTSATMNNSTATTMSFQQFQQTRNTSQQHNLSQNISETSSPFVDSQEIDEDDDEDDGDDTPIDFSMMGRIDVKEITTAQRRRIRRKNLKKQFDAMKRGNIWEINNLRGK